MLTVDPAEVTAVAANRARAFIIDTRSGSPHARARADPNRDQRLSDLP
jgi:hypothetical protein